MERKQLEIACPCCKSRILVDLGTGQVLRTRRPEEYDETGRPLGSKGDWDQALGRVQGREEGAKSKLEAALDREKRREADLEDLFKKARKRAEEGEPGEP
jgi:hypothetical protein